ncbi:glycine C-acetyltransferase [Chytriomyces confervae]|uniref:2-amino-3-ketobutyrate coenzyme A ligase, mitochondrial n=1 Tax=Chytriomyces confervae TaxID=246404 RepID=A0A507EWR6_9FUNG|nr:glycine C-acetyltransferase [Chytriomyces confervae]
MIQSRAYSTGRKQLQSILAKQIEEIKAAGTFKNERVITTAQSSTIGVKDSPKVVNFCANNYLGFAGHPAIREAAKSAIDSHGNGLGYDLLSYSLLFPAISDTASLLSDLESTISKFHKKEDTILYPSCFDANAGIFETILTENDAVISDALNHASIIDGIRLCKAKRFRYKNCDMADLEERLKEADAAGARIKLIATDGVFSMDGSVAPLDKICDLADKYNALTFIDECHATGFFGKNGRGTPEYFGVEDRIDIINSTLGKAVSGAAGGYTTSTKEVITLLRQRSRPYLFSNSIPPAVVGSAQKAFELIDTEGVQLRKQLVANTNLFRSRMAAAGFTLKGENHPIVPVMLGDAKLASDIADEMLKRGIYVIGFSYPVVPKGQARIRVQLSAIHTTQQVNEAVDAFIEIANSKKAKL